MRALVSVPALVSVTAALLALACPSGSFAQSAPAPVGTAATPDDPGRVGTLSPDEARRAARARERANAAAQPAAAKEKPSNTAEAVRQPATGAAVAAPANNSAAASPMPPRSSPTSAMPAKSVATAEPAPHMVTRRQTAALPPRHAMHARHRYASARTPRVGDMVPPGVPLYALPPGYGAPARTAYGGPFAPGPAPRSFWQSLPVFPPNPYR